MVTWVEDILPSVNEQSDTKFTAPAPTLATDRDTDRDTDDTDTDDTDTDRVCSQELIYLIVTSKVDKNLQRWE